MNISRILVIKYGAIGDFIAGTSILTVLRNRFPHAHIVLLSKRSNRAICPPGSIINEFWEIEQLKKGKLGYLKVLKKIRKESFDLVVNLRWNSEILAIITSLSGAAYTAGISRTWTKYLYNKTVDDIKDFDNRHEYLKNTDALRAIGIEPGFPVTYVHVDEQDVAQANKVLGRISSPYIILCPTASTPLKAWLPERYIELGKWISKHYQVPLIISWAGKVEYKVAAHIVTAIGDGAHLLPAVSINVLAAIMRQASLCICNNSGSLHIAFSQRLPVICFNTSKGWEPYGPNDVALNAFHDKPGFNLVYTTNEMAAEQLATITVQDAILAFEKKWHELA